MELDKYASPLPAFFFATIAFSHVHVSQKPNSTIPGMKADQPIRLSLMTRQMRHDPTLSLGLISTCRGAPHFCGSGQNSVQHKLTRMVGVICDYNGRTHICVPCTVASVVDCSRFLHVKLSFCHGRRRTTEFGTSGLLWMQKVCLVRIGHRFLVRSMLMYMDPFAPVDEKSNGKSIVHAVTRPLPRSSSR